jgi:RNA polymerase sigma factor (sigma-70 family)
VIIYSLWYKLLYQSLYIMQSISDSAMLTQLEKEDSTSFELLYKFYYPSVATYVTNNRGNAADAEDVFQEAIIILLQKVRQKDFTLTSTLKTYLFAIAKNIWLKKLRDNKIITVAYFEKVQQTTTSFTEEIVAEKTREEKAATWIERITENCQRILKAIFFYQEPMDSLMKKMGWKNKHTAANQQYKCIQQVKKQKDKDKDKGAQ